MNLSVNIPDAFSRNSDRTSNRSRPDGDNDVELNTPSEEHPAIEYALNDESSQKGLGVQKLLFVTLSRVLPYNLSSKLFSTMTDHRPGKRGRPFAADGRKLTGRTSYLDKAKNDRTKVRFFHITRFRHRTIRMLVFLALIAVGVKSILWMLDTFMGDSFDGKYMGDSSSRHSRIDPFDEAHGIYRGLPRSVVTAPLYERHHIYQGLLHVNMSVPAERHPIYRLIKDARDEWDAKKQRQSRTLLEAVNEYKSRNEGRAPPKGFEKWWRFVV